MTTKDIPGWFAKILLGVIGVLLTAVGTWVASASERQARAFKDLESAVYKGQTSIAVLENKVENIDTRVKIIEAKLYKEK